MIAYDLQLKQNPEAGQRNIDISDISSSYGIRFSNGL